MIAANSSFSADTLDADPLVTDWYHIQSPDLNEETAGRITKAQCHPMWFGIHSAIRKQIRKGKTAAIKAAAQNRQISTGIRDIARDIELDPKAARTQLRRLAKLGLIAITQDDRPFKTDPVTGRILENRVGRARPVTITLTIRKSHLRPESSGKNAKQLVRSVDSTESLIGGVQTPPDFTDRGRVDPTSKESSKELNKERPSGLTDGIGRPMAKNENTPPPPLPMGSRPKGPRITPAARTEPPRPAWPPRRTNSYVEPLAPPVGWQGVDADAFAYTKAKIERERQEREGVYV